MYGKDILRISRRKVLAGTGAALAAGPLSAALHVPKSWAQAKTLRIAAGEADGARMPENFQPLSFDVATWALAGIAIGGLILACVVFSRREYRDLT